MYYLAASAGPYFYPTGPIGFPETHGGILMTNPDVCTNPEGTEICLITSNPTYPPYKFMAPVSTMYYCVFTGYSLNNNNLNPPEKTMRITVKTNPFSNTDDGQGTTIREFYESSSASGNDVNPSVRKFVTFSWNTYLNQSMVMWLDNQISHSLNFGPTDYRVEWMVYRYTDDLVARNND